MVTAHRYLNEGQARQKKRVFLNWCPEQGYERAVELIDENWEQMVRFYRFPCAHWRHLRTGAYTTREIREDVLTVRLSPGYTVEQEARIVWRPRILGARFGRLACKATPFGFDCPNTSSYSRPPLPAIQHHPID